MEIIIRTKNLKLTQVLETYIKEKIGKIEKGKPIIEAWVELEKTTLHHKKGPFFKAECKLKAPGKNVVAEASSEDLRLAIDEVRNELQRELRQYKEKQISKTKRKARIIKKELKISPEARFYRKGRIREEGI